MSNIPTIAEKCTGALLASGIGDALGWPNEQRASNTKKNIRANVQFQEWTRRSGGRYWSHYEKILPGEYSDDTQMILAVARSIITGNWENTLVKKELPYWLEYERGGGSALKKAAILLRSGKVPWESTERREYFLAGGNGAAMRILPHVIAAVHKRNIETIISDVIRDSIYTHGHPRAILGALCYAFALHYLMNKETVLEYGELIRAVIDGAKYWKTPNQDIFPSEWLNLAIKDSGFDYLHIWSDTASSMLEKLEFISDSLNKGLLVNDGAVLKHLECFDKSNGAGDVAILSALYFASKYANNPVLGIKTAAYSLGADTDTIASMSGGLLGMLCGTSWIPTEWKLLQDYDCLANIAEILIANNMIEASKHITSQRKIYHNDWKDSPIGKIRVRDTSVVLSGKSGRITIEKIETMLGQTLYLKKYERIEKKAITVNNMQGELFKTNRIPNTEQTFLLTPKNVQELMDNQLLMRITFKKVLQIVDLLMAGNSDCKSVADKLKVDKDIVEVVNNYINKA